MMRSLVLAVAAAVLVVPGAQAADGETCQGRPATIVQSEGVVEGTDGDDVIFATGDQGTAWLYVYGKGGNDLICVGGHLPDGVHSVDASSEVQGGGGTDTLVYVGSDGEDHVRTLDVETIDIHTGGGVDDVTLAGTTHGGGVVDGGPEPAHRNSLTVIVAQEGGLLVVELGDEEMWVDGVPFDVTGFDRVSGIAETVVIDGDGLANRLEALACHGRVRGDRGDDVLRASRRGRCHEVGLRLLGQKGNDRLRGSMQDDVLIGGPGRDVAYGRGGRDACRAEIKKSCER